MEIEYSNTENDLANFHKYLLKNSSIYRRAHWNHCTATPMGFGIAMLLTYLSTGPFTLAGALGYFIPTAILLSVWIFFIHIYIQRTWPKHFEKLHKDTPGVLGKHIISLEQECLLEKTDVNEAKTRWHGVIDVAEDTNYIYIFTKPIEAHVIPKNSFSNSDDAITFYKFAKDRLKN